MIPVHFYAAEVRTLHKTNERPKKLYEILAEFCEVPQEVIAPLPVFTIRGKHEIEITGCTGIRTYDSRRIVLSFGEGKHKECFCVTGDSLILTDFREKILYVRGNLHSASFGDESTVEGDGDA